MLKMDDEWRNYQRKIMGEPKEGYSYPTVGAFYQCWKEAWMKASEGIFFPSWNDFEQWANHVEINKDEDKALALLAWNGAFEVYKAKIAMLQHELMQTRHELASCETALRSERQERAK